jgi:hypothetical protein
LELKLERLPPSSAVEVLPCLAAARNARERDVPWCATLQRMSQQLKAVNAELWDVEEKLRWLDGEQRFDGEYIELARSVYAKNDRRAALKRAVDAFVGSALSEPKSHPLPEAQ